jgi:peptidoglycan/LPS O-acetylase OafA/YrhL
MNLSLQILRAVSIILVLLYHYTYIFPIPLFDKSYLGVDIFFVLSGFFMAPYVFLIKNISPPSFYFRRIIRLYPSFLPAALFALLIILLFINSTTYDFILNLKILFSSLFGLSNEFLQRSLTGYFDTSSIRIVFLHTWSLSVEFQFFFFVGLLILLTSRFSIKPYFLLLLLIALIPIFLSISYSYYSFFSRYWQFFLGILAFFLVKYSHLPSLLIQFLSPRKLFILSLFFLLFAFVSPFIFHQADSQITLTATISSAFIVLFISSLLPPDIILTHTLRNLFHPFISPLLFIGSISYELYLVHWPLLSLSTFLGYRIPFFLYLIISLFLATFLYRFYCHFKSFGFTPRLLITPLITSLGMISLSFVFTKDKSFDYRNSISILTKDCNIANFSMSGFSSLPDFIQSLPSKCRPSSFPSRLIIGDSTSVPLASYFRNDIDIPSIASFRSSCLIGLNNSPTCTNYNTSLLQLAHLLKISNTHPSLILSQRYEAYFLSTNHSPTHSESSILTPNILTPDALTKINLHYSFLEKFKNISGIKKLTVVTYGPTFPFNYWNCDLPHKLKSCSIPSEYIEDSYLLWSSLLSQKFIHDKILHLYPKICYNSACYFNTPNYIYADYGHLSLTTNTLNYLFSSLR